MANSDTLTEPSSPLMTWICSDDTGESSKCMAMHLAGAPFGPEYELCHPCDPADFGRCYRFLRSVPAAQSRLSHMARVSPVWSAYIAHWDELTQIYEEEFPSGVCPRLYARMKELAEGAH